MTDTRQEQESTRGRWAWRLGSLAGISIYVHATFVDAGRVIGMLTRNKDQLVGLLDLEHVGELLAARGAGNGGVA